MKRRSKPSQYPAHFISGYVRHRVPLFHLRSEFAELCLEALHFYRAKHGLRIYGYVVMPEHYHLLLGFPPNLSVRNFLRDFKSYLGRQMVDRLAAKEEVNLLRRFRVERQRKRKRDPTYAVLQPDNDDRVVYTKKFFNQKLRYIHNNPVKRGLVAAGADYPWSSCRSYLNRTGQPIELGAWD